MNLYRPLLLIALLLAVGGCDRAGQHSEDSQQDAAKPADQSSAPRAGPKQEDSWREFAKSLAGYSGAERKQAVAAIEEELKRVDVKIDVLESRLQSRAGQLGDAVTQQQYMLLNAIKDHRAELAGSLSRLKNSSADAWDEVKQGFSETYTELSRAYRQAEAELRAEINENPAETNPAIGL